MADDVHATALTPRPDVDVAKITPRPLDEGPIRGPLELDRAVLRPIRSGDAFAMTVQHLATAIRLGVLAHGATLPPERELAARLGVARVTLREAIGALREAHLIATRRGRGGGSVVVYEGVERVITRPDDGSDAEAPLPRGADLDALLDYQRILEPGAAALAASRALTAAQREALRQAASAVSRTSEPGWHRVADSRLLVTIAQVAASAPLLHAVVGTRGVVHRLLAARAPSLTRLEQPDHAALVDPVLAGDTELARLVARRICDRTAALLREDGS